VAGDLAKARRLREVCLAQAGLRRQQEQERIKNEFDNTTRSLDQQFKQTLKEAMDLRGSRPQQTDAKASRIARKNEQLYRAELERIERARAEAVPLLQQQAEAQLRRLADLHKQKMASLDAEEQARWQALEAEWKACIEPIYEAI